MSHFIWRLVRAGLAAALVVGASGWAIERARFGPTDQTALSRIEAELRQRLDASAETLGTIASQVAARRDIIRASSTSRDIAAARRLFEVVDTALSAEEGGRTGITVYDAAAAPLAWAGRVSDLPQERINGPAALLVAPGALGPQLIRVEPLSDGDRPGTARAATIVVEQSLGRLEGAPGLAGTFAMSTSLVPVSLRVRVPGGRQSQAEGRPGPEDSQYTLKIPSRGGGLLVEADVAPGDLAAARERWRGGTWAAVVSVLAITLLLCAAPLIELRQRTRDARTFLIATSVLALTFVVARAVFWFAARLILGPRPLTSPAELLLTSLVAAALIWLTLDAVERRRITRPRPRLLAWGVDSGGVRIGLVYLLAGLIDVWLLASYERFLQGVVSTTALDVLHFSLHPISATRLAVAFGLVLFHAVVIWGAAIAIRVAGTLGRTPRQWTPALAATVAWLVGLALGVYVMRQTAPAVPVAPLVVAFLAVGACAAALARLHGRARRASQAARLGAFFLALLIPAIAMYPSLFAFATDAKERLIATEYGPQAAGQREELQLRLREALDDIDGLPSLADFVAGPADVARPTTDRAFAVWSKTDLATHRLTSAIELYRYDGRPVSRFAFHLSESEYATTRRQPLGCDWDLFPEVSQFGSSERHVLRASRGICEGTRRLGAIVVRVMLDYRALTFSSSQNPYLESHRPDREIPPEGAPGRDVEFVAYGWSRAPVYASGTSVWSLPDSVFQRMVDSRAPFWETLTRDGEQFRVYFLNDRAGIYALGYPVITWFGHLVNLAELVTLTGVLYIVLLGGATLFNALTSRTPASGRALLREIRSSFYRKLFLAFVAGAVVPVVILAIATRAYFAGQFRAGVDEAAAKTATVAQRLVEDYATLQQRGASALGALDDQIMVLVSRAIDQDVNLFDRARLQATSEPDLFASGLLATRTPGDVYRQIVLDRLPTFVGEEYAGEVPYLLAAAPVRAGGREGIVTVPLTLRQVEIESQIDELDRRVLFAAVLFSLFGAAIGYWMAERIADPVNRLTRATRRIARGDLDARIVAASSDELGRLVGDFNGMAEELKRQRAELERTQRLEAWAGMARQVAHDIKNPLTPIQLSAEHARRVNIDRGRPLSPVLDDCVHAILTQVRLLRQISAEFSGFASSPTPRPEPTRLTALLEEVVESYRTGLTGRIAIEVDAPADLPPVMIDRTLFARALTNVIENALHAMPGRGRLTITNRQETIDGRSWVVVRIADTGVGMDSESIAKIFEPYFSTKATGTGLGLTIAKRNVELNGGTIRVQSERGVGTTVTIALPV